MIKKVYLFQLVAFKIGAIIKCVNWLSWTSTGSSHRCVFSNQLKSENIETLYLIFLIQYS